MLGKKQLVQCHFSAFVNTDAAEWPVIPLAKSWRIDETERFAELDGRGPAWVIRGSYTARGASANDVKRMLVKAVDAPAEVHTYIERLEEPAVAPASAPVSCDENVRTPEPQAPTDAAVVDVEEDGSVVEAEAAAEPAPAAVGAASDDPASVLLDFMRERHAIYTRRAAGDPKPWTDDPVLRNYRFCNIHREHDAVTVWIREHIREPYAEHDHLWFMLCIARMVNYPATLADLIAADGAWPIADTWSAEAMVDVLQRRESAGEKVWTGAYVIPNMGLARPRSEIVAHEFLGRLWAKRDELQRAFEQAGSLQRAHAILSAEYGWGAFMSYEVICDMRYTRYLRGASDALEWASAGPGSSRGLNRLRGRPLNRKLAPAVATREMRDLLTQIAPRWSAGTPLEMREIEHSLCELDKWYRARNGEGTPRARYNGGRA